MSNSINASDSLSKVWSRLIPHPIVRGEGCFVFDVYGKQYIDFTCGIGVTSTGHCHPKVVAAVQHQAEHLLFGQINCMLPQVTSQYCDKLVEVTPDSIDTFFFSNSGAEAVEGAVKLAKIATGRTNVIAFDGGFHGRTAMTMALTSSKSLYRAGYQPLPAGIVIAPFPNTYRYRWDNQIGIDDYCLSELDQILNSQSTPSETAAMIVEPVLGEGGFVPAPPRFLQGLRNVCDATGILLIVDEVQTGFGRTGNMWGHSSSNIVPDIMTMAKGIASGLPLSAIGASRDLMNKWPPGAHGGTYGGGSALAMVAAIATLNIIQEENLVENAVAMGNHLRKRLQAIVANIDIPSEIRGPGLMIGIELGTPEEPNSGMASRIQTKCLEHGLMLLTCGPNGNVIRWVPPLNVTKAEIDSAVDIFSSCF